MIQKAKRKLPALWTCPKCKERFTTSNQWHSCGVFELEPLFANSDQVVRRLYKEFEKIVRNIGPVTAIPQKTRIAFQARMRFAAIMPQKHSLRGHLVLARRRPALCFERIETISLRNHLHVFRVQSAKQLDKEFRLLVAEAYEVGCQQHLNRRSGK